MLSLLAAAAVQKSTVWEKIQAVPKETWINIIIIVVVVFALVSAWKTLGKINEMVPWIAFMTIGVSVLLYWTHERTEPKMLSPLIDELARVLPSGPARKVVAPGK